MNPAAALLRTLVLLVLAVLGAVSPRLAAAAPAVEGPRVLILHSYAPDFSWTRDLHAGIVSVLDTPEVRARYRVEYLDAKHHDSPAYRARLLALGLTRGVVVELVNQAPLGDPVEISLRGFHLSLRRSEAAVVEVVPL